MSIPTGHPYNFDPTYGLAVDELRAIRPPPPNFDEFWRARHVGALGVNPQPRLSENESRHPSWRVHDIVYAASSSAMAMAGELLRLSRQTAIGRIAVSPPPPHFEFAARIGGCRETVTKLLNALEREGLISRSRAAIGLTDVPRLRIIAGA